MRRKAEEFQNFIGRLYPADDPSKKNLARSATLQVTDGCNLACSYCYQLNKSHHIMSFDTAKEYIDILLASENPYINTENSPGIILEFIGGEPFLAIDLIDKVTDYFIDQMVLKDHPWATKFMISICSNGTLYFDPKVQAYIKKHIHHLSFSISIDGNKELHDSCRVFPDGTGSYDLAVSAAIDFMSRYGNVLGSKMTLAPQNISYTSDAVKNLILLGYKEIYLNCCYEKGWENCHAKILYQELKKVSDYLLENDLEYEIYLSIFEDSIGCPMSPDDNDNWCGGTGEMLAVDYKGDIYPCLRYMESSTGNSVKPLIIGTVKGGIMETDSQNKCVNCLKCITRRSQSTDECFNCPIAKGCAWCSAYNYQEFGTPNKRATYICDMHKARVLANVYFWNSCFKKHGENKVFAMNVPDEWALEIIGNSELEMLKQLAKE